MWREDGEDIVYYDEDSYEDFVSYKEWFTL